MAPRRKAEAQVDKPTHSAHRRWCNKNPPEFSAPKQLVLVEKMGLDSGRANVIRMLTTGELDHKLFFDDSRVSKLTNLVMAITKVVGAKQVGKLVRGNTYVDGEFLNTTHIFVWREQPMTMIYGVVERRFFVGDPDELVARSMKDTRGRHLEKQLYGYI